MARASVKWNGELKLIGKDQYGHEILMEMLKKYGGTGEGTTPMDLFLVALGGCAGLDIVTMLKARGQPLTSYEVKINGIKRKEHPKFFSKISLKFTPKGDLDDKIVDRVVHLNYDQALPHRRDAGRDR
jgi:putative redox protein